MHWRLFFTYFYYRPETLVGKSRGRLCFNSWSMRRGPLWGNASEGCNLQLIGIIQSTWFSQALNSTRKVILTCGFVVCYNCRERSSFQSNTRLWHSPHFGSGFSLAYLLLFSAWCWRFLMKNRNFIPSPSLKLCFKKHSCFLKGVSFFLPGDPFNFPF